MATNTITRIRNGALLGIAGLGAAGTIALSGHAAHAADPNPATIGVPAAVAAPAPAPAMPAQASLEHYVGALQPNGYYCGPAATRIALSAHGTPPTFDSLASELGTTTAGTNSIDDITRVLDAHQGEGRYTSTHLDAQVSDQQTEQLRTDVMKTVNDGDAVVANIAGKVTDTAGENHAYMGGHYLTITGYTDDGHTVTVTDPADKIGSNNYQLPINTMANWMTNHGYSS
jgi:Peptidase_C39 like family